MLNLVAQRGLWNRYRELPLLIAEADQHFEPVRQRNGIDHGPSGEIVSIERRFAKKLVMQVSRK